LNNARGETPLAADERGSTPMENQDPMPFKGA
jgi:hypothetical protein